VHRWVTADKESYDAGRKRVYYLSLEFLIGRLFTDALNNMGLFKVFETRWRISASASQSCANASRTPRSAMAAWDG